VAVQQRRAGDADVGDHATALTWLTEVAHRPATGDPERLVDQLMHARGASMTALGLEPTTVQAQAAAFDEARQRRAAARRAASSELPSAASTEAPSTRPLAAFAWFPAGEYDRRWLGGRPPSRAAAPRRRPHAEYCRALQARLMEAADAGATGMYIARSGSTPCWRACAERGVDPRTRADYAADLARTAGPGDRLAARTQRACWCGSRASTRSARAPKAGGHD
jgi:hypothetical protein